MPFRELTLIKAYSSDVDNILFDFYVPVLEHSVRYDRLAGFFSSSSLAVASRGIISLIKNGGYMRLIVSPKLHKRDLQVILSSQEDPEQYIEKLIISELDNLQEGFIKDHVSALGWMIANNRLELKVAIICDESGDYMSYEEGEKQGIFHQKVGILYDSDGNILSFSGSINESANAWLNNIEEFKVFRSWITNEEDYVKADVNKFESIWKNSAKRLKVLKVSEAIKRKLIDIAPDDIDKINWDKLYRKKINNKVTLFPHQEEAVKSWFNNNMKGIFEMATGTGKTFTALECLNRTIKNHKHLLCIITCPYQHLVHQWKNEIEKYGINSVLVIGESSNPTWKDKFADTLTDLTIGYINSAIVLVTFATFAKDYFMDIIEKHKGDKVKTLLIADEVHGLGAKMLRNALKDEYDYRLGLSATPKRWFDDSGTRFLYEYFNDVVFEFTLRDAINNINPVTNKSFLTPYKYIPHFITLSDYEREEYVELSQKIWFKLNSLKEHEKEDDTVLKGLMNKRANIKKNAYNKYSVLEKLIDNLMPDLKWCIIYCTPQQIDHVMRILNKKSVIAHKFTMEESTTPSNKYGGISEREFILKKFAEGEYQVLVAMKCLDEGVDVPPARTAILLANSGNPREYIQRIGRVIRRFPNKEEATIHDIIVVPEIGYMPKIIRKIEWNMFLKEVERYEQIAEAAINNVEVLSYIYKIKNKYRGAL